MQQHSRFSIRIVEVDGTLLLGSVRGGGLFIINDTLLKLNMIAETGQIKQSTGKRETEREIERTHVREHREIRGEGKCSTE